MHLAQDVFVTTTPTAEGYKIISYLDVVTAHVVAGTNIFSDFAASFSDIFGGQSKSYQKQLTSINEEVINQLRQEAARIGANGIVGLRIDHDQISGQGKSMFMVTATGTAVQLETTGSQDARSSSSKPNVLTADELAVQFKTEEILQSIEDSDFEFDEASMAFLREHRVVEAAPKLIPVLEGWLKQYHKFQSEEYYFKARSKAYFMSLPDDAAKEWLYKALLIGNSYLASFCVDILRERKLFDADWAARLLSHEELAKRKRGLYVLTLDKAQYSPGDISSMTHLLELLEDAFPTVVETFEKQHTFSSKTTQKWECLCGAANNMDAARCSNCKKDRRGFAPDELQPEKAEAILRRKIAALSERFAESGVVVR